MGFDLHRFHGEVDEELVCSLCAGVLDEPLQTPGCEHMFCKSCITEWISKQPICPIDKFSITMDKLRPAPRIVRNMVAELRLSCDNARYGCKEIVKMDMLSHHLEECPHAPKTLIKCQSGCGMFVSVDQFKDHNCVKELRSLIQSQQLRIEENQKELAEQKSLLEEHNREMELLRELVGTARISEFKTSSLMDREEVLRWSASLEVATVRRWGGIISTPDELLQALIGNMLVDMGCPACLVEDLVENSHERKWPSGLCSLEARQSNRRNCEKYVCKRIPDKQAVLILACDNVQIGEDLMIEPGLVMIFAHGVE